MIAYPRKTDCGVDGIHANARPRRRGQAPKPHRGAPKAQGLTAAIAVAGPSPVPSIASDDPVSLNSTGADVSMRAFATLRIYTSLTGTTQFPGVVAQAQVPNAPVYAQNGQQNRQAQTQQAQSNQAARGYGVYSTQSSHGTWLFAPDGDPWR